MEVWNRVQGSTRGDAEGEELVHEGTRSPEYRIRRRLKSCSFYTTAKMNLVGSMRTLIVLVALCWTAAEVSTSGSKEIRGGRLKVIVVDWQEAQVVGTQLLIQNKGLRTEVTGNERGEVEIDLPIGVYRVSAQGEGFQKFSQKGVKVEQGRTTSIKILLKVTAKTIKMRRDDIYL